MDIELVHSKLSRGMDMAEDAVYMLDLTFGSPFVDNEGKHIGKAKTVHMSYRNGMPPEDFALGLRALADHIENTVVNSDDFKDTPSLVVDNDKTG